MEHLEIGGLHFYSLNMKSHLKDICAFSEWEKNPPNPPKYLMDASS